MSATHTYKSSQVLDEIAVLSALESNLAMIEFNLNRIDLAKIVTWSNACFYLFIKSYHFILKTPYEQLWIFKRMGQS